MAGCDIRLRSCIALALVLTIGSAQAEETATLLTLATERYGMEEKGKRVLSAVDQKLFEAAERGTIAFFEANEGFPLDRFHWLCSDPEAIRRVHVQGIWIQGAQVDSFNLTERNVPFPLWFLKCKVGTMNVFNAQLNSLNFVETECDDIFGSSIVIKRHLSLRKSTINNGIAIPGAEIQGGLSIDNCRIHARGGTTALNLLR